VISSSQRPLPDNTQQSQQTNIHAPGGIRTHDLSTVGYDMEINFFSYESLLLHYKCLYDPRTNMLYATQ
jgi:hypothetical protein